MSIRVLVADDQALVRAGLVSLLDAQPGIEVVGEAADGRAAVDQALRLRPDVVLMDVRMPVLDGISATRELAQRPELDQLRIVVVTTFELDEYVFEALRAGASGFLVKHSELAELIRAVRVVAEGDALLSPGVTRRLVREYAARARPAPDAAGRLAELTEREHEVLVQVARGLSNDEVGRELVMSPATARTHVSRILMKVGARDRAQLVVLAYESGLVRPGWNGPAD